MRKTLLAGVSCAALALSASQAFSADPVEIAAAPAPALPYINAVMSLWAGAVFPDSGDSGFDEDVVPTFGGDARIGGQQWLLEIYGAWLGAMDTNETDGSSYFLAAGHYLMRDPGGNHAYGVFGGLDASGMQDTEDHSVNAFIGLEGAIHTGNMNTFFGQFGGSFNVAGQDSSSWDQGLFGRAGWRHFFSPDQKLELDASVAWGEFDDSNDGWGAGWGAEYEQQVSGGPFSWFGAYRGTYTEDSCDTCSNNDVIDHTILGGVRVRTGGTSLYTDYMDGSSIFNIPAHHFNRWRAFPEDL